MNITDSLEQLSYVINGGSQNKPTSFLIIELCLNTVETTIGNIKYT
ncbi:unnamed protein product, partial [Rotaria magnacalcarata]